MAVVRFLFALLLGFLAGAVTVFYLMTYSGAGDLVIKKTEVVQDLERKLRDAETQRDQLARQFEDFARRAEGRFGDLEQRFRDMDRDRRDAPRGSGEPQ